MIFAILNKSLDLKVSLIRFGDNTEMIFQNEYDPEQEEYGDRFLDAFEFGYAITVHSSQGSQWESVLFMDQKAFDYDTQKRLEYTAITRARTQIGIVLQ